MKVRYFFLVLLLTLLVCPQGFAASSERWINSARCAGLCENIQSCAAKAGRPELSRLLCHVAACEVGKFCGRKEIRSPNGLFYGPFQFTRATWRSVCQPLFKQQKIKGCSGKKSIYNTCCTTMCASQ